MTIGFLREKEEESNPYIGKWVRIETPTSSYTGVFQKQSSEGIYLKPSYVPEPIFKDGETIQNFRLEENVPTIIGVPGVVIQRISEGFIKRCHQREEEIKRRELNFLDDSFFA